MKSLHADEYALDHKDENVGIESTRSGVNALESLQPQGPLRLKTRISEEQSPCEAITRTAIEGITID